MNLLLRKVKHAINLSKACCKFNEDKKEDLKKLSKLAVK